MKLTKARASAFTLTVTAQELAALFAAVRVALDRLRVENSPREPVRILERLIRDYEYAVNRFDDDGRP